MILFFPPCCCQPAMLEEGVSDHRHERMTVKALPGPSLEVVKTEFFFHLLVSLLGRSNNAIPSEPHATASPSDALLRIDVHRDRRKPTILGPAMSVLIIAAPHVAGYQPRVMKSAIPNANSRTRAPCRQQYSCFPPTTFVNGCSCITAGDGGQGVAQRAGAGQKRAAQRVPVNLLPLACDILE